MRSRGVIARVVLAGALAFLGLGVTEFAVSPAAFACYAGDCDDGPPETGSSPVVESSPTESADYSPPVPEPSSPVAPAPPPVSCSVYANGTGMGSYCREVGADGGASETLRQRFGGQSLQRCRFEAVPDGVPVPHNSRAGEGRYMLMSCLDNVDLDTYDGGRDRAVSMSVVFVPHGRDVSDRTNAISEFMWNEVTSSANQMPIPVLVAQPNPVPVVGTPTYFTFRWVDPATKDVVAQGPYADRPGGGPFLQITSNGVVMRARATELVIDPNQEGIDPVTCSPATPYNPGAGPEGQPADACVITFPRSSASAQELNTEPIPEGVEEAFYATVRVQWRVTYGQPGNMQQLGSGFSMGLGQAIPVQEVQAPNQPPTVIY